MMDERRLRKFFHFTKDDLLANRRGQFSENQKKRLSTEAKARKRSARESAIIMLIVAGAGMAVGLTIASIAPASIGRILILLLMGILWPAAWAGKGLQIIRAAHALQDPHLCQVSGRAQVIHYADGSHGLKIGKQEFDVDGNSSGAVWEDDEYTVYYLEATEEILSIMYVSNQD